MTPKTEALIEAAEELLTKLSEMGHCNWQLMTSLQSAVASARAEEGGVETMYMIEYRHHDQKWRLAATSPEPMDLPGPGAIFDEVRLVRRDTYTSMVEVREKDLHGK